MNYMIIMELFQKNEDLTMQLLQAASSSDRLSQAIFDLDMVKIFTFIDGRMKEEDANSFVNRYFTDDPFELSQRLSVLEELSAITTAEEFQKAIDLLSQLEYERNMEKTAVSRFRIMLYQWRLAAVYVKGIDTFLAILTRPIIKEEGPSDSPERSMRLQHLREFFERLKKSPLYTQCAETLKELKTVCPLPRFLHVGMNLRDDGYPIEMGVLREEGRQAPLEEVTDEPLNALLSCDDPSKASLSLGPEFVYNRALYGSHFDEYLERAMEKEWKGRIQKATKLTEKLQYTELDRLIELIEPLSFYQEGLLVKEAFENRGYPLCKPTVEKNVSLTIKNALYPEFILHNDHIQGNDLYLQKGNAVIITGPNHSGKTSYLKTIGQCYFLAQLGFFVPASSMVFDPIGTIYTLFSAGEDLSMSKSRMGLEVKKLTQILKNASSSDLVLLNEPMTSTNPVEAVSICADLTRHFLENGITHLLVTHLYDVYFLLRASLKEEFQKRLESLITQSRYDADSKVMVHSYHLIAHDPLGNSYARETALSYGITLENMVPDDGDREKAERYLSMHSIDSIYQTKE